MLQYKPNPDQDADEVNIAHHAHGCQCAQCCGEDEAAESGGSGSVVGQNPSYNPLAGLDTGYSLSDNNITVFFAPAGFGSGDGVTSDGWLNYEIQQFEKAFDLIESVVNVNFQVVSSPSADFKLIADINEGHEYNNALGYMYFPTGSVIAGTGVFNAAAWDSSPGGDLEVGGFGFVTIVHELLHGMGLAHPHDSGGFSSTFPGVTSAFGDTGSADLNQGIYTTMSYNTGVITSSVGAPGHSTGLGGYWGYEAGPMALDIAVLQDKYGANTTHNNGNNTYVLPSANAAGTYWKTIWDTGGTDIVRFDGSRDVKIDLRQASLLYQEGGGGYISAANGIAGGFTIANGVVIENATSGSGNDVVNGNAFGNVLLGRQGNDRIFGFEGNDHLWGGFGNDTMNGGKGNDVLNGQQGNDSIRAHDGNDTAFGGEGSDTMLGSFGFDRLFGNQQRDILFGNQGNDWLDGGLGNDVLWGGLGNDTLLGFDGNDVLHGQEGNDRLNGQRGNDVLNGNQANDTLLGGFGADTLNGGLGNDRLIGNQQNDVLNGNEGNDTLDGGQGNDTIVGGVGNDVLFGFTGADTFRFNDGFDVDRIADFAVGVDTLQFTSALTNGITNANTIISTFATVTAQGVVFDFGGGDVLTLVGVNSTAGLATDITIL